MALLRGGRVGCEWPVLHSILFRALP